MSRTINLRLSADSERLIERLERKGLSEKSAIAKALWLLDQADKGNIGLLEGGVLKDKILIGTA